MKERSVRPLSVDDMRRIVSGGELFLLVDVRPLEVTKGRSIPRTIRLPFGQGIEERMLAEAGQREMPIVVSGDGEHCPVAELSAHRLELAGFKEVWTYCGDPEAWVRRQPAPAPVPSQVVSDPDLR